jgi:hypothetical protein
MVARCGSMDELRTHVEQLARTPRPPGTEAHAQALTYLEQVFRQQGWQPRRVVANEASAHLLKHGGEDPFVERAVVQANSTAALRARLSDHGAFWEAGFPALLATDTAFLRNPHYHRESDTPDKLDHPFLRRSTGAVAHWLRSLLEAP